MHAIQPFDLCRSNQPLRGEGACSSAIAHQPLHGVVALTRLGELEGRICPHGFEHLV
jgi:hypothetical protein